MTTARPDLGAFYGICQLARIANVTRHLMWRLLGLADVRVVKVGRLVLVPLSEIREKVPPLWDSLQVLQQPRPVAGQTERARDRRPQRPGLRSRRIQRGGRP